MSKSFNKLLDRKVTVRFRHDEYERLNRAFKMTTKRKLSEYVRAVVLEKPVTVYTRNKSYDDFVAEIILLRNELKFIGNNFNQLVKKLHTLYPEKDLRGWLLMNENSRQMIFKKVEEINDKITQIASQWSQE